MDTIPCYPRLTEAVNHPLLENITLTRLDKFVGGLYASQNLTSALDRLRVDSDEYVQITFWSAPGMSKPTFTEATRQLQDFGQQCRKGQQFGPSWTNHWLHVRLRIPESVVCNPGDTVIFEFDPGCEALIYTVDGIPLHAITGGPNSQKDGKPGNQEDRRVEHIIPLSAVKEGRYECYIEVSANGVFGLGRGGYRHQAPDMDVYYTLAIADIVCANSEARALGIDFQILSQIARASNASTSAVSQRALKACNDIMNTFRPAGDDPSAVDAVVKRCRQISQSVLGPLDAESQKSLAAFDPKAGQGAKIWAIGHCHIDTAWLWGYTQTQQKIGRSWSTQCDIMDRYPNHTFAASSAQQFVWLKEYYPAVFDRVTEYVKKERFVPVGGAWLEHDCMLPSGESMVRHYLYGQRYFEETFNVRCREAWLPDTFGYASQLPQILRLAGIDYFFTQKLSWNNINRFPYSTFNWCGIDGTQVLAHMTPVDSYNSQANYSELIKGAQDHKNLAITDECLLLFGNGDGGGGPTPLMLEKLQRLSSVGHQNSEVPGLKIGKPVDFFDEICRKTHGGKSLPTWRGELYFELHRGTYTSQAAIKKGNRIMERLLRDVEYYGTLASLQSHGYTYPQKQLDDIWKDVLLNQFHDVLPGTSIRMANEDAWEIYSRREKEARLLLEEALGSLPRSTQGVNGTLSVLDPFSIPRTHVVEAPSSLAGKATFRQDSGSGLSFVMVQTDAYGVGQPVSSSTAVSFSSAKDVGGAIVLANSHLRMTVSGGRITSLFDVQLDRELILPGPGALTGGLMLYEDFPLAYDAWDAEIYHLDCCKSLDFQDLEILSEGPIRASIKAIAVFGKSKVEITFSLDAIPADIPSSWRPAIRIDVTADWWEKHKFLKFALPVDIHSPNATFGTQFGIIERPTHRNTTIDQAKFEVCGHGFGDLSEPGYGIALVSDGKYGYGVEGNTMRLSLLRSAVAPDAEQDEGLHHFSFHIMPHVGRLEAEDVKRALALNSAPYVRSVTPSPTHLLPHFAIEGAPSIIVDTVKRGQNDPGASTKTVILRLYQTMGGRTRGTLKLKGVRPSSLQWVNLLEEPMPGTEKEVQWNNVAGDAAVELHFRGFEIRTLAIYL